MVAAATTPRSGGAANGCARVAAAFEPHTGQHRGQKLPEWNTG
jgi:hypothetical protein